MKIVSTMLLIITILFTITACANSNAEKNTMAIGEISQQQLIRDYDAFQQSYQAFALSEQEISVIKGWPNNLHIDIYSVSYTHLTLPTNREV